MSKYLFILSEGTRDEMFYELVAERVTGSSFQSTTDFRLREGANRKTAMASARLLMSEVKRWKEQQDVAVIIAVDNDRSPDHPGATTNSSRPLPRHDLKKPPRYPALVKIVEDALGSDHSLWPVDVALAVPVEMIENWALLLMNPTRPQLPLFAEASQPIAREYYGSTPPPQLKDLRDAEAKAQGLSLDEFFRQAAKQDLDAAASVSPSFALFLTDLRGWRKAQGS